MRSRMQRVRITLLAAVTLGAAVLFYSASPATADVDSIAGSATPVLIEGSPLTPGVAGQATEPQNGYGPIATGPLAGPALPIGLAPLLALGLLEASTQGGNLAGENHLGFATSIARVANVVLGGSSIGVVTSQCVADGDGARGSTTIVGTSGLPTNPAPNTPATTTIPILGIPTLLSLTLNEQIVTNTPGTATITVNAVHLTLLGIDVILAQSTCTALGPNVNVTTTTTQATTTTTAGGGTTTTTTGGGGTTTTTIGGGGTTSTTAGGGGTTSTTAGGGGTTSTTAGGGGTTTTAGGGGGTATTAGGGGGGTGTTATAATRAGVLARTGATMQPFMLMALLLTVMGMLMFFGSNGLTDPSGRTFSSHPMFRPVTPGRSRVLPAGASSRLDPAALDALAEMEGMGAGTTEYDGTPPEGNGRRGRQPRQWFTQRPW